jgi:hypothetical protein
VVAGCADAIEGTAIDARPASITAETMRFMSTSAMGIRNRRARKRSAVRDSAVY